MFVTLFLASQLAVATDPSPTAIAPPDLGLIRGHLMEWVEAQDKELVSEANRQWEEVMAAPSSSRPLDAVLRVLFLGSAEVRQLVDSATADQWGDLDSVLSKIGTVPVVDSNLRLFLGKTLIELGATEEAESVLEPCDESACIDPAALVFYRAVCFHARLDKEPGLKAIDRLLDPASIVAERHRALARLMKQDLQDLDDNDLAKTAREMKNLQQKLQRGKSGQKTQEQERQILQKLDKMIEKLEQQQKQAQGQGGQPAGNQPDSPADESRIAGQRGPGEVDRKPIGKSAGWGNLPEKARTEAKNLINRQFPSHYRRAVEEYLKKLAERPAN